MAGYNAPGAFLVVIILTKSTVIQYNSLIYIFQHRSSSFIHYILRGEGDRNCFKIDG